MYLLSVLVYCLNLPIALLIMVYAYIPVCGLTVFSHLISRPDFILYVLNMILFDVLFCVSGLMFRQRYI